MRKAEYAYDAYGNCEIIYSASDTDIDEINPIRYRGYYYDRETKLYYLNSRYYNPEWRRFISPDDTSYLDPDSVNGLNLYAYCGNDPVNYADPSGHFPILAVILGLSSLVGMGLTIGGVVSDNNVLTAVGLTMVAAPALISGGMAISLLTPVGLGVGITTSAAGIGTGLFASAEYQEAFTGNNWMLDVGMSEGWYNGLMLTTASLATLGTLASSVAYSFKMDTIIQIGKIKNPKHDETFYGIKFKEKGISNKSRSLEFHYGHSHKGHKLHWQLNTWSKAGNSFQRGTAWWTLWLTRIY